MSSDKKRMPLTFSAIDQYLVENIIEPTEGEISGQKFIQWGDRNLYPTFVHDAYFNSHTLKSVVRSVVDYVVGNGCHSNELAISDEKLEDLISAMAFSYAVYGGFAVNVLRNKIGGVADIVPLDMRCLRSNKENTIFYYSEDYGKKSYGRCKYLVYEKYDPNKKEQFSSIFYYKNERFQCYPSPLWSASLNAAIIENRVGEYHLNSLANGFSSNILINMNNGVPSDEQMEEIEENFNEKFCGSENAGRVVIAYNNDKEHAASIEKIDVDDYADRYTSLTKWCKESLFSSFRCNPQLVGIATESNGFNSEEYQQSYALFMRTVILPIQKIICNSFDKIFGKQGVVEITPFDMKLDNNNDEKTVK